MELKRGLGSLGSRRQVGWGKHINHTLMGNPTLVGVIYLNTVCSMVINITGEMKSRWKGTPGARGGILGWSGKTSPAK